MSKFLQNTLSSPFIVIEKLGLYTDLVPIECLPESLRLLTIYKICRNRRCPIYGEVRDSVPYGRQLLQDKDHGERNVKGQKGVSRT